MNRETRDRLRGINRRFYSERADEFSASRDHPWPGWTRLCAHFRESGQSEAGPLRILDVGCGNGRFAAFLGDATERPVDYLGIDASQPLLDDAVERMPAIGTRRWRFVRGDVLTDDRDDAGLPHGPFDVVVAFGLLHHIPGRDARAALVNAMAARLRPGGILGMTIWQFGESERFLDRRIAWEDYNAALTLPIDTAELEPGDQLLHFGDTEAPPRYCHALDAAEWKSWIEDTDRLAHLETFLADGRGGQLNRYLVLRRDGAVDA